MKKSLLMFSEKFEKTNFCNTEEITNKDLISSNWLIWEQPRMSFILTIFQKDLIILPSVGIWQIQHSNDADNETKIQKIKGQMCKTHTLIWLSISHLFSVKLLFNTNLIPGNLEILCYAATYLKLTTDSAILTHAVFPLQYWEGSICTSVSAIQEKFTYVYMVYCILFILVKKFLTRIWS